MKPTKEQFQTYLEIQQSGVTNMFDVEVVCAIGGWSGLQPEHCFYIFAHYADLKKEYGV